MTSYLAYYNFHYIWLDDIIYCYTYFLREKIVSFKNEEILYTVLIKCGIVNYLPSLKVY
jgi:hypothetical protein